jgi:PKHD-type hydroxylase
MEESIMFFFKNYNYVVHINNLFNDEEINKIHYQATLLDKNLGVTGINSKEELLLDISYRETFVSWFEGGNSNHDWLFDKMFDAITLVNNNHFHLDITGMENIQYSVYPSPSGKYKGHLDINRDPVFTRKISWSVQLTDQSEYEGGDLLLYHDKLNSPAIASKQKGTAIFFLSNIMHEVQPVISGERRSLVGWVSGPPFR